MMSTHEPISLRIDATTHCQLKCPSCPTAEGKIEKQIGGGFLTPENFCRLLDDNPSVAHVELSNWGEIFLNPHLEDILACAYERRVALTASNGVNMNNAKRGTLESLVKYRFRHMTVSLDGASQETYSTYRIRGNFDQVIKHIETINEYKRQYRSPFPILLWQFIVFGHNEHEIAAARELATRLDMQFYVKLSWDEDFSPIRNLDRVRKETKGGVASRSEYLEKHHNNYIQKSICRQLWDQPQINWDGRVLGCCMNHWGDFGNAFADGLMSTLDGPKMRYAKQMVTGHAEPKQEIPCTTCHHYIGMRQRNDFLTEQDLESPLIRGLTYQALRRFGKTVIGVTNSSSRMANMVLQGLINVISKRMLK